MAYDTVPTVFGAINPVLVHDEPESNARYLDSYWFLPENQMKIADMHNQIDTTVGHQFAEEIQKHLSQRLAAYVSEEDSDSSDDDEDAEELLETQQQSLDIEEFIQTPAPEG